MRKFEEIMNGLNIYYSINEDGCRVYLVQDNYSHQFSMIKKTLEYCHNFGITIPQNEDDINIEILGGERYKRVMSIEFNSSTIPNKGTELTKDSGFWDWLKY